MRYPRCLALLPVACSMLLCCLAIAGDSRVRYRQVPLTDDMHTYDVTVARGSVTTLLFPEKKCQFNFGDDRFFRVEATDGRIVISARTDNQERTTDISVRCGYIDLLIGVSLTKPGRSGGLMVDFRPDTASERKTAADVEKAVEDANNTCQAEKTEAVAQAAKKVADKLLTDMASRSNVSVDREHGRNADSLIVHVDFAVTVGTESYVRFTLENGTQGVVNLSAVNLYTENTNDSVESLDYAPRGLSVGVEQTAGVAARFETPLSASKLRLVVKDAMGRTVEVDDIEL